MRYQMTFSYDGTNFYGFQKQHQHRTVQQTIEDSLTKINHNRLVSIVASGRTDRHVHAYHQVAHFDMEDQDEEKLCHSLNQLLPEDIYVQKLIKVSIDFHARYQVVRKEYIYKINLGEYNPIEVNYVYQYNRPLNIEAMKKASIYLLGEHDFKSFTQADSTNNYIRNIEKIKFYKDHDILIISFIGNGFLRYMVRNLVGLLLDVGSGKREVRDVSKILAQKDRTCLGSPASPNGLYLNFVEYENKN